MQKKLKGTIISVKMNKTVVVEVVRQRPHPLYRKIMTKRKKYKASVSSFSVKVGDKVIIGATKPISKETHFKIIEVIKL